MKVGNLKFFILFTILFFIGKLTSYAADKIETVPLIEMNKFE